MSEINVKLTYLSETFLFSVYFDQSQTFEIHKYIKFYAKSSSFGFISVILRENFFQYFRSKNFTKK